jgi:predicted DNA-binding protein
VRLTLGVRRLPVRPKTVYVSDKAHQRLRLLAARRGRTMGEIVDELVSHELAELANPWTSPEGLWLQQQALADVWSDPALDAYDDA